MKNIVIGIACGVALAGMLGQEAKHSNGQLDSLATSSSSDGRTLYLWKVGWTKHNKLENSSAITFLGCATADEHFTVFMQRDDFPDHGGMTMSFERLHPLGNAKRFGFANIMPSGKAK